MNAPSDEELGFLESLRANPRDEGTRMIYADWLEEHGDPRAEFLLVDLDLSKRHRSKLGKKRVQRWNELRMAVDPVWLSALALASIPCQWAYHMLEVGWFDPDDTQLVGGGEYYFNGWDEIVAVITMLDSRKHPCCWLEYIDPSISRDASSIYWVDLPYFPLHDECAQSLHHPGRSYFYILGGHEGYALSAVLPDGMYCYHQPTRKKKPVTVWHNYPGHAVPASRVCADLKDVLRMASFFSYHGKLHPEYPWRFDQPSPWDQEGAQPER